MKARVWCSSLVLAIGLASAALAGDTSPFTFHIPTGWAERAPENPQCRLVAADTSTEGTGFITNVNVVLQDGVPRITSAFVDAVAAEVAKGLKGQTVDARIATVGGIEVGRFVTDYEMRGVKLRLLQYALPGHGKTAIVSCTTTTDRYASCEGTFEKFVAATDALEPAPSFWSAGIGRSMLVGAVIGGLATLLKAFGKKKS